MNFSRILTALVLGLAVAACGGSPSKPNREASKILPTIGSSGGALGNVQAKKLFGAKATVPRKPPPPLAATQKAALQVHSSWPKPGRPGRQCVCRATATGPIPR
jgi:penicillin-insensitive murein endopeptidase